MNLENNIYLVRDNFCIKINSLARNIEYVFISMPTNQYIFSGQNMEASIVDRHNYQAYLLSLMGKFDKHVMGVK